MTGERSFTYTINITNNERNEYILFNPAVGGVTKFIIVSLFKFMSQIQYLKMLEKEIQRINKKIDLKIIAGQDYLKEAKEHKLLLQKVRYHSRRTFFARFFPRLYRVGQASFSFQF